MMFETLSYLPRLFLNQSYESYIQQHLLDPLNMTSTTYSVEKAEASGNLAEGHLQHARDVARKTKGHLKAVVPYWARPGEEKTWAGAGGIISSARDLVSRTPSSLFSTGLTKKNISRHGWRCS